MKKRRQVLAVTLAATMVMGMGLSTVSEKQKLHLHIVMMDQISLLHRYISGLRQHMTAGIKKMK